MNQQPEVKSVAFIYIIAFICLYACVINFVALQFSYINLIFPDVAQNRGIHSALLFSGIRWSLAVLFIAYPMYLYIFSYIFQKFTIADKASSTRRFLAHLTIFIAVLVLLTDLMILLYYFLNGELTVRFLLKTLVVFISFAWVFYFYRRDLKNLWTAGQLKMSASVISFIVAISIGYGIFIVGSPVKARYINIDSHKVRDLNEIQNRVIQYWITKRKLPATLIELGNETSYPLALHDPQTDKFYSYRVISDLSFELCAVFNLDSASEDADKNSAPYILTHGKGTFPQEMWNWQHKKGNVCFLRVIDPKIYK